MRLLIWWVRVRVGCPVVTLIINSLSNLINYKFHDNFMASFHFSVIQISGCN